MYIDILSPIVLMLGFRKVKSATRVAGLETAEEWSLVPTLRVQALSSSFRTTR